VTLTQESIRIVQIKTTGHDAKEKTNNI